MTRVDSRKSGSCKRFSIHNVPNFVFSLWGSAWLSVSAVCCGLPTLAHSQPPSIFQAPQPGASAAWQLPDLQWTGSVSGTVVDETGAVIVGAQLTLTSSDRPPLVVQSGDYGQFSFAGVAPGAFVITITAPGFAPKTTSGILHSGEIYLAPPAALAPASLTTEVRVSVPRVEVAEAQIKAQEKQRVIGVVPNFYVSYVPNAVPLTSKQKFSLAWRTMIDPFTIGFSAAAAGVQQAQNDFSGYGQGVAGYAKRFGASYADDATGTFIGGAILPSLLKQDPRYFYKGTGSVKSRILYAFAMSVICKGDNQRWQPNYSAILGGLASGAISNLYYPPKDRGTALVFEDTLVGIGETAVLNLLQEFVIKRFTTHTPKSNPSHP